LHEEPVALIGHDGFCEGKRQKPHEQHKIYISEVRVELSTRHLMIDTIFGKHGDEKRTFYIGLLTIAIPVVIQNLLSSSLNMVDNLMIGRLGENSIAAVGLANQVFFIYSLIIFGLSSGASIFYAQHHGSKDYASLRRFLGMASAIALAAAMVFTAAAVIFPGALLRIFTTEPDVIADGTAYLRIVGLSYALNSLSFSLVFALRATNQAMVPMAASSVALATNTALNYILINGYMGFPALGVTGAAIATVIARVIEFFILIRAVYGRDNVLKAKLSELLSFTKEDISKFFRVASPVIINESMWAAGIVMYNFSYSRIGVDAFASVQITNVVSQLFYVFAFGVCNAASIMIGNRIGEERYDLVKDYSRRIMRLTLFLGITTSGLMLLLKGPILSLYRVTPGTLANTGILLTVVAAVIPVRIFNVLFVVGFFRGGGDTRFAMGAELISLWFVGVPAVAAAALIFRVPVTVAYSLSIAEDLVKFALCYPRYRSGNWFRRVI
jgi:putative MATE family efflux protein